MIRALLPIVLSALAAAPFAAQETRPAPVQAPQPARPVAEGRAAPAPAPASVQRSAGAQKQGAAPVDAARVAALRARLERAKASGKFTPERLARQEERLARLEQQLAAQPAAAAPAAPAARPVKAPEAAGTAVRKGR